MIVQSTCMFCILLLAKYFLCEKIFNIDVSSQDKLILLIRNLFRKRINTYKKLQSGLYLMTKKILKEICN